jgi:acetyltransferase
MQETARELYTAAELERLINPGVVAVVGASDAPGSFGQRTLANMAGFTGEVIAINPKYRILMDRPCVPSLADMTRSPDCVVVCTARASVRGIIEAAGAVGAGGAIIYASGFSETGKPDRIAAQAELVAVGRRVGVKIAGPNCVGIANTRSRAGMNFMPDYAGMGHRHGPIAIVSQSGALGYTVLQAMERGVGFSHYLAAGNSADVDVADYIAYAAENDDIRAIIALFEGVADGARFLRAAARARDAGKALIVYKAGNSEISSQAALSHTGTMVGAAAAYRAAFERVGAVVADDLELVLEMAAYFARSGVYRGGGVGVLSTSGGAAVICADKAELHGVALPALAAETAAKLHTVVPEFGSVANPADLTAEVLKTAETFAFCLDAFLDDSSYGGGYVVPMVFSHASSSVARAPMLIGAARRTDRPIAVVWMNEWLQGPGTETFDSDSKVSIFRSTDRCFATIRAWMDWHARRERRGADDLRRAPADAAAAARCIVGFTARRALSETESKRVLAAYGIDVPAEALARDPEAAAEAAEKIGFPVVVKIASPDILHKTEVDGIRLSLESREAVRDAAAAVLESAARHRPDARLDGVSVQQMVFSGVELVVGVKRDSQFGPLVAVGLGGVMVELLGDTVVRLAPVSMTEARMMLAALKGARLLSGYRGSAAVDIESVADLICRVSELADDLRDSISEIDVNPVIVTPLGAVAADALIVA